MFARSRGRPRCFSHIIPSSASGTSMPYETDGEATSDINTGSRFERMTVAPPEAARQTYPIPRSTLHRLSHKNEEIRDIHSSKVASMGKAEAGRSSFTRGILISCYTAHKGNLIELRNHPLLPRNLFMPLLYTRSTVSAQPLISLFISPSATAAPSPPAWILT